MAGSSKCIFLEDILYILFQISWKFVAKGPINNELSLVQLTHWGRVTHICVSKLTIIGSDNGLSPGRRQAIIWTNAGILLIRTLGTNFSEILGEIYSFSFKKMHLKMSSAGGRLFSRGLNELMAWYRTADQTLLLLLLLSITIDFLPEKQAVSISNSTKFI